jgi:hypothetical protein
MPIIAICPGCNFLFVPDATGRRARCPKCKMRMIVKSATVSSVDFDDEQPTPPKRPPKKASVVRTDAVVVDDYDEADRPRQKRTYSDDEPQPPSKAKKARKPQVRDVLVVVFALILASWAITSVNCGSGNSRVKPSGDLEHTVIKRDEGTGTGGAHLRMDVLVSERAPKRAVMALAEYLRERYAHQYDAVVIGIWDSEDACRRFQDLPDSEAYRHFLAEVQILGRQDEGRSSWVAKGRDH